MILKKMIDFLVYFPSFSCQSNSEYLFYLVSVRDVSPAGIGGPDN
jgi:hypothetical protein